MPHRPQFHVAVLGVAAIVGCAGPSAEVTPEPRATLAPAHDCEVASPAAIDAARVPSFAVADANAPRTKRDVQLAPPEEESSAALSLVTEDHTSYRVPVGDSPVLGNPTALVTIVEFSDYQCPFCIRADATMRELASRYGDQIRIVWKDEPLSIHKYAEPAAELALEARAEKGDAAFWSMHEALMQKKGRFDDDVLADLARSAGLDVSVAMRNVHQHKYLASIDADGDLADDVGALGTPTFFINGHKVVGAQPLDTFATIIDEQLGAARVVVDRGVAPEHVYDTLQKDATTLQFDRVTVPAPTAANPARGPADAKIVIQLFSDYECPFCKWVEPTLAALEDAFPGQIRLVWRNHPLPFHRHAELAAEAAMEAYAQKGAAAFWRMHEQLMKAKGEALDREAIEGYALIQGLDMARFRDALDHKTHAAEIEADTKAAMDAGLRGTPACVINGLKVTGAQPLTRFKKAVKQALSEAK